MQDTKKLNAGIALLALQSFAEAQVPSEEDYAKTVAMAYRLKRLLYIKIQITMDTSSKLLR